jgi:hypothetical protein
MYKQRLVKKSAKQEIEVMLNENLYFGNTLKQEK